MQARTSAVPGRWPHLPGLQRRLLHRTPPHGGRGTRPGGPGRRLHLRGGRSGSRPAPPARGQERAGHPCPASEPVRPVQGRRRPAGLPRRLPLGGGARRPRAQQVFLSQRDFTEGVDTRFSDDAWDGYVADRDSLRDHIAATSPSNPVVLTGDVHANYVCDFKADFNDPASRTVATELVGTSISTGGNGMDQGSGDRVQLADNPHIKSINRNRGYVRNVITRSECTADFRVVEFVGGSGGAGADPGQLGDRERSPRCPTRRHPRPGDPRGPVVGPAAGSGRWTARRRHGPAPPPRRAVRRRQLTLAVTTSPPARRGAPNRPVVRSAVVSGGMMALWPPSSASRRTG